MNRFQAIVQIVLAVPANKRTGLAVFAILAVSAPALGGVVLATVAMLR